jgi:hypothetical protein
VGGGGRGMRVGSGCLLWGGGGGGVKSGFKSWPGDLPGFELIRG